MPVFMEVIDGFLSEAETVAAGAGKTGEAAAETGTAITKQGEAAQVAQTAANPQPQPKQGLQLQQPAQTSKPSGFKLKSPGGIALLLLFILFLVFAIAPAYGGSTQTRLQVLMNAIFKGGHFQGSNTSASLSSFTNTAQNGAVTQDYNFTPAFSYSGYGGSINV